MKSRENSGTIASFIRAGKIGVVPTDTLYGIVCSTLDRDVVERLYRVRGRDESKPCIVLIASSEDLARFGIAINEEEEKELTHIWRLGPVSIVLPCLDQKFSYLHRGAKTLAFRIPADEKLRKFLEASGPIVAPSANPEGKPPAKTIEEARNYFGDKVDFYANGGVLSGEASTLVRYAKGRITVLRKGAVDVS